MTGNNSVYYIWYGDFWQTNSATQILANFAHDLNGTDYLNIAHWYADGQGNRVQDSLNYGGAVQDTDYLGDNLTNANVQQIVQDSISSNALPSDSNAVYFVMTAPGIREEEDTLACGWHSNYGNIKYSWVSPALGCDFLGGVSGNGYADSLTETMSHELMESLTDPEVGTGNLGWYDNNHGDPNNGTGEIGDSCVQTNFAANLNGHNYDVQSIFARDTHYAAGGYCASANPVGSDVPEPGSLALLGLGMFGLLMRRRKA